MKSSQGAAARALSPAASRFFVCMILVGSFAGTSVGCDSSDVGPETSGAVTICDGSSGVRLAAALQGGGQAEPGRGFLSENGWQLLLVDGACTAWVLADVKQPLRTTVLDQATAHRLASDLRLAAWPKSLPPFDCFDASVFTYHFGDEHLNSPACVVTPDSLRQINAGFATELATLSAIATPATGDVRYLVLPEPGGASSARPTPVLWPLDVPIASVAGDGSYTRGHSQRATGTDAALLREIRNPDATGATLVTSAAGERYQLYLRDALPFEQEDGLLPPGTF